MISARAIQDRFFTALDEAHVTTTPYRHWLLGDVLPAEACAAVTALPFAPPAIDDTQGKRETHNSTRVFFAPGNRARFAVCDDVAEVFQSPATVRKLEAACGVMLKGSLLRIEYCQDTDGFWLEPHTDIGAKLFTMLIYLSTGPGAETLGTDIYDAAKNHVGAAPAPYNSGLIFVPGADTWHGFERRPIRGVRKSLIVNYVKDEWRSRHELAYPDRAVA
jgi:hypothetical protein